MRQVHFQTKLRTNLKTYETNIKFKNLYHKNIL